MNGKQCNYFLRTFAAGALLYGLGIGSGLLGNGLEGKVSGAEKVVSNGDSGRDDAKLVAEWKRNEEIRRELLAAQGIKYEGQKPVFDIKNTRVSKVVEKKVDLPKSVEDSVKHGMTSKECVELIKRFENFEDKPYWDVSHWSVGYGHMILSDEKNISITKEKAETLLLEDLKEWESVISKYVKVPLKQGQYDSLCSFLHNFGETKFRDSTLLEKLNGKDYIGAAKELKNWVHVYDSEGNKKISEGLVSRRNEEYKLFTSAGDSVASSSEVNEAGVNLILKRDTFSLNSLLGKLYEDVNNNGDVDSEDIYIAETLELPYNGNKVCKSSIPEGKYDIGKWCGNNFKNCFEVKNVPGRTAILIHQGNYPYDTAGCILVGGSRSKDFVGGSRAKLNEMNKQYKDRKGNLKRKMSLKIIGWK